MEFEKDNLEVYNVKEYREKIEEQRVGIKLENEYTSLEIDYDGRTKDFLISIKNERFRFTKRVNNNFMFLFDEYKVPMNYDSSKEFMNRILKSILEDDVSVNDLMKKPNLSERG